MLAVETGRTTFWRSLLPAYLPRHGLRHLALDFLEIVARASCLVETAAFPKTGFKRGLVQRSVLRRDGLTAPPVSGAGNGRLGHGRRFMRLAWSDPR
jgi:hypothetical protein